MSRSLPSSRFYGREAELSLLRRFQSDVRDKGISRFVVVTGRRRVGKTRLLEEALPSEASMPTISGYIASQLSNQNLSNFVKEIERVLAIPYPIAIRSFEEALTLVFREAQNRPLTLILDEFQNFKTVDPTIFDSLQRLWDRNHLKSKILLVTCGSVASSMREIFENGAAPLFARESANIHIDPFFPELLKTIFSDYKTDFSGDDLLALYTFTGGVSQYVQSFLSSDAFSFDAMLEQTMRFNSGLISEAQLMVSAEFKGAAPRMNEILLAICQGKTKRPELASLFDVSISGHLFQLEKLYGLIEVTEPLGENGAKRKRGRYTITDELLNFWYTFCLPNLQMLQVSDKSALMELIRAGYPTWSGRALERLYRRHFCNCGLFTAVGPWWDKKGENEIDLVAVNPTHRHIVFAEIKRDESKIRPDILRKRSEVFLQFNPRYADFERDYLTLSLNELSSTGKLPFSKSDGE